MQFKRNTDKEETQDNKRNDTEGQREKKEELDEKGMKDDINEKGNAKEKKTKKNKCFGGS